MPFYIPFYTSFYTAFIGAILKQLYSNWTVADEFEVSELEAKQLTHDILQDLGWIPSGWTKEDDS